MPYIEKQFRLEARSAPVGAGELNYQLTMLVLEYLQKNGWHYTNMNLLVGTLENVRHEFQRRVMDPYEDHQRIEHGEVYPDPPLR